MCHLAAMLPWTVARAVRRHRLRPAPRADNAPRHESAPHFVLKPGPRPGHTEPREPREMPRDGKRRTAHHLAGFGNLGTRPRRGGES